MPDQGYFRFPAIYGAKIVFVSEDDLWIVDAAGGVARRLTSNLGTITSPYFSPDGDTLAFTGREEGNNEVYTMPSDGGPIRRVTYLGCNSIVLGWTPDGKYILFSTDSGLSRDRVGYVQAVSPTGGLPKSWPVGPAMSISIATGNRTVLGRNNNDPARWKRYRGGQAGDLWIDDRGEGEFHRLIELAGNIARPMWIGERIYFLSDKDGVGDLYSCSPLGDDLKSHANNSENYLRYPSTDGERIVYHAGADLFIYDPRTDSHHIVEVIYHSPRVYRQRKFVDAAKYLDSYSLHPKGHMLSITTRGKSFVLGNWEGAVLQKGAEDARIRHRLSRWLYNGKRMVTVTDVDGVDTLEVHTLGDSESSSRLTGFDIGRPVDILSSPTHDHLLLTNHRNELLFIDIAEKMIQVVDKSDHRRIGSMDWSPDGMWAAYAINLTKYTTCIKLWNRTKSESHIATVPVLHDTDPAFDPDGKYLYFLGQRELNPVYDSLHFDLSFPRGTRPYLITLKADQTSPFLPQPHPLSDAPKKPDSPDTTPEEEATGEAAVVPENAKDKVIIDLDGIESRVIAFPVPDGIYGSIVGIKDKALFTSYPVEGALNLDPASVESQSKGTLEVYDFKELKHEALIAKVSSFQVSQDRKTLAYFSGKRLRVVAAGTKPDEKAGDTAGRKSGYIDLSRVKVSIDPGIEWRQMAHEAWRLQRDHFWSEDMSQIDWEAVWKRYEPLIERVGTRGEFSDLMWEMQGELGTSHAYEIGGDYRAEPSYPVGHLGADFSWDKEAASYRIERIVKGAPGEARANSPLNTPGVNAQPQDKLLAINGQRLTEDVVPQQLLVNQAGSEVTLTIQTGDDMPRDVTVRTLRSEFPARYREWVESNRQLVHDRTSGRIGYVHIPDMGANGYAEFHRLYLSEVERDGLIVDVRYNRGGHVSQLILEKLSRKRLGYDIQRWGQPDPYPSHSVAGPMVAITNQFASSDGDIFSHAFKLKKLGVLIGKRTWGGVVGIWPRHSLADGSVTTQPEFAYWFEDVGWAVENYGTDPDIDIDITPQDYARGRDPQMEKAIEVILEKLESNPPVKPTFSDRPNLGRR